jgi:hypothetical protein
MSCIILRGHWCHIIFLNVHVPTEDEIDDVEGSFFEELECMFNKYHKKILLGDFSVKVGMEGIFKPTNRNECLHETSGSIKYWKSIEWLHSWWLLE